MNPYVDDPDFTLYVADVTDVLASLEPDSVDCVVTSPPYWGLRDYQVDGQLGLESSPDEYVARMVDVFRRVRRVLKPQGTVWLNIGDSYATTAPGTVVDPEAMSGKHVHAGAYRRARTPTGLKPKDLFGIPWRLAFALQADGWYLRADIIWSKPNPMPESVTDRPTKAHEYVFLLSRQPRYFYDADAIREPAEWARWGDQTVGGGSQSWIGPKPKHELTPARRSPLIPNQTKAGVGTQGNGSSTFGHFADERGRNKRSVWEIATEAYPEAHFATFPQALVEPCVKAGCPEWVCGTCGKPRERIVKRTPAAVLAPRSDYGNGAGRNDGGRSALVGASAQTLGWSDCGHNNYRPGVVLDPFMGSGTTALVARRLGRRSIGIELNPTYAGLAAKRLDQLSLLAGEAA